MTTPDEPTARGNVVAIGRITTVGPDGDCVCERAMLVEFKDTGSAIAATQSGHVSFTVFGAEVGESPAPDDTAKLLSASIELERLRKALLSCARQAEALKRDCSMDPESPQALRNAQYQRISTTAHIALGTIKGPDAQGGAA